MSKKLARASLIVFLALVSGYLALQIMLLSANELVTQPALLQTVTKELPVHGVMLRNEQPVFAPKTTGYLRVAVASGERVSAGGLLAAYYPSEKAYEASAQADRLRGSVAQLDAMLSRPGLGLSGLSDINRTIRTLSVRLAQMGDAGDLREVQSLRDKLCFELTRRQLAVGEFDQAEQLRSGRAEQLLVLDRTAQPSGKVVAEHAGFFVSYTDGLERRYDPALAPKMTVAQLKELQEQPPESTEGAIGKLVEDYTWYYVCQVPQQDAQRMTKGKTYRLRFAHAPQQDMSAVLESVTASGDDGYVLTFAGKRMQEELLILRSPAVSVALETYEGLRVSNEARRVVDGVVGVYVRVGLTLEFRPIEVLYATDAYSIVKWQPGKAGALKLYDEVVLSGKQLFDGRIVE